MKKPSKILPQTATALKKLGSDIYDARRRRRITRALLAERARITPNTLAKIEKGDPGASMGGYASVLFSLGMIERLRDIADARHDFIGQTMVDEQLPQRVRMTRR